MVSLRDTTLDKLKGIAILLVVVGHTIQSVDANYDHNLLFRVIYSFHMPFFVLLSGASASFWVNRIDLRNHLRVNLNILLKRTLNSGIYLLVPFFTWTGISYLLSKNKVHFAKYLFDVIRTVDLSLWFLPVIFWCIVFLSIGNFLSMIILKIVPPKIYRVISNYSLETLLFLNLSLWIIIRTNLPRFFGVGMVNTFHGGLFLYFLIGIYIQSKLEKFTKIRFLIPAAITFALLVPFWSRVEPHNFTSNVPLVLNTYYIGALFTVLVAASGSIAISLGGNMLLSKSKGILSKTLLLLGTNTLGIYAFHLHFIFLEPYVLTTIVLSLVASMIFSRIPILRTLLLGKL